MKKGEKKFVQKVYTFFMYSSEVWQIFFNFVQISIIPSQLNVFKRLKISKNLYFENIIIY